MKRDGLLLCGLVIRHVGSTDGPSWGLFLPPRLPATLCFRVGKWFAALDPGVRPDRHGLRHTADEKKHERFTNPSDLEEERLSETVKP